VIAKWLSAARQRVGGVFPRPEAKAEMEVHARRIRDAKARKAARELERKARKARAAAGDDYRRSDIDLALANDSGYPPHVELSASSKSLALKWVLMARQHMIDVEERNAEELRRALADVSAQLLPELDFFYTEATRLEGAAFVLEGQSVQTRRNALALDRDEAVASEDARLAQYVATKEAENAAALTKFVQEEAAAVAALEEAKGAAAADARPHERRVALLEEKLSNLPETSADADGLRIQIEAVRAQAESARRAALDYPETALATLRAEEEKRATDAARRLAERVDSHARSVGGILAKYLRSIHELEDSIRDRAMPWLIRTKSKVAKRKQAEAVVAAQRGM
jgi:hypothetical protein